MAKDIIKEEPNKTSRSSQLKLFVNNNLHQKYDLSLLFPEISKLWKLVLSLLAMVLERHDLTLLIVELVKELVKLL